MIFLFWRWDMLIPWRVSLLKPCVFNTCHVRLMSWKLSRVRDSNLQRVGVYMLWTTLPKDHGRLFMYVWCCMCTLRNCKCQNGQMTQPLKATSFSTHNICKLSNKVDGTTAIAILAIKMWHLRHNTINGDFDTESRKQCWTLQVRQHTMSSRLQDLWETVPKAQADSNCEWNQSCHSDWIPPNINNSFVVVGLDEDAIFFASFCQCLCFPDLIGHPQRSAETTN